MLSDPNFYLASTIAIAIFGISKGGFGGGLGIMAVPIMALAISPSVAAAVMLPLLCLMDVIGIRAYWGVWDRHSLSVIIPGSIVGILLGTFAFGWLSENAVRLIVGVIALAFVLNHWRQREEPPAREPNAAKGLFWGSVAGFTSTLAHAGGPPANIYFLPLKLDKAAFVGSMVVAFALINYLKLIPYLWLGLFTRDTLIAGLILAPVAGLSMLLGLFLHKRIDGVWFYRLCYLFLFLTGSKLIWDGLTGLHM
ncbi:MAG: sulfite exporter TauE/SafE family protein [Geminicoccaceae bacterium]